MDRYQTQVTNGHETYTHIVFGLSDGNARKTLVMILRRKNALLPYRAPHWYATGKTIKAKETRP